MRFFNKLWPPLLLLVLVTTTLEILNRKSVIASYILPAPSDVLLSLLETKEEYLDALIQTFQASLLGLLLSIFFGISISILLSTSKLIERAFFPYAVFFQTVPVVSIAPLLVIWFGFGLSTVVVSSFIVSVFPIIANTLAGMRSSSKNLKDLFKLFGSSRRDLIFKLQLPSAIPQILTGVRVASGLSMIGAIVGEFIAGGGLGGLIDMARTQQRLDKVFASILLASFMGIMVVNIIDVFSKVVLRRWQNT